MYGTSNAFSTAFIVTNSVSYWDNTKAERQRIFLLAAAHMCDMVIVL